MLARICLYSLLALGLNVVVGFAGLLDIGYVAFFGIGSYIYAFLASPHFGLHLPFLLVMPIVTLVAAISGVLIGAPTLRLRGDYLAIVTLGFGEITYICLVNLDRPINITGGPSGLISIDPPSFFGYVIERNIQYYYLFLVTLGGDAAGLRAAARLADRLGLAGDPRGRARRRGHGRQHDGRQAAGLCHRRQLRGLCRRAARLLAAIRVPRQLPVPRVRSTSWPW